MIKRIIKTVKILAIEDKLPKWLRGMGLFGIAPVPGPFDEIVLMFVAIIVAAFYREVFKEAWNN